SWPYNLLADPKARIEIEGTAGNYLSRPATEEEVDQNMPRLIEMWPAHDTYDKRSGTRNVYVFEPLPARTRASPAEPVTWPIGVSFFESRIARAMATCASRSATGHAELGQDIAVGANGRRCTRLGAARLKP